MAVTVVVAISGGKDSTALALALKEREPSLDPVYLITPTGDELPEMVAHWENLERLLGKPFLRLTHPLGLNGLIEEFQALPNWRQRWCTRLLKIKPCLDWMKLQGGGVTLCVGLRADEPEREGLYSQETTMRFPLREWGWGLAEVQGFLRERGITVPKRTDCARCYYQRLPEWWDLWKHYPDLYADAERQEEITGRTFRSPKRDSFPAALKLLRAEFEKGRLPRGMAKQNAEEAPCRVCRF